MSAATKCIEYQYPAATAMRRLFGAILLASLMLSALPVLSLGQDSAEKIIEECLKKAAKELDKLDEAVEEYGSVEVSAPLITRPTVDFNFDLSKSADNFYTEKHPNGASRLARTTVFNLSVAGTANFGTLQRTTNGSIITDPTTGKPLINAAPDVTIDTPQQAKVTTPGTSGTQAALQAAVDAANKTKDSDPANNVVGTFKTASNAQDAANLAQKNADAADSTEKATPTVQNLLAAQQAHDDLATAQAKLAAAQKADAMADAGIQQALANQNTFIAPDPLARDTDSVDISARAKTLESGSDKATEDMLKWLAHPHDLGDNKVAFFCVMMVSAHPGNRTFKGYSAEVTVHVDYARTGSKELDTLINLLESRIEVYDFDDAMRIIELFRTSDSLVQQVVNVDLKRRLDESKAEIMDAKFLFEVLNAIDSKELKYAEEVLLAAQKKVDEIQKNRDYSKKAAEALGKIDEAQKKADDAEKLANAAPKDDARQSSWKAAQSELTAAKAALDELEKNRSRFKCGPN